MSSAQAAPEQGSYEIQAWGAGGHSVPGGTAHAGIFDAGFRFGWVLSDLHLPGVLRGRFEYALDAVPIYVVRQQGMTAYGAGFDAIVLKWNFERHGRLSPYAELSGGTVFSNHDIPNYTNTVNFTPSAAFGTHILGVKYNCSLEMRYLHISNAGLATPNPGLNTLEVRVGFGRFFGGHSR